MKKCRGFGELEGKCNKEANKAGFFCTECDEKRMSHIDKQFDKVMEEMEKRKSFNSLVKRSKVKQ